MGAGKSTIGKQLADTTGREFIDSDQEIVERTGAEIDLIFELEGEEGFRKRENRVIGELIARDNIVLATGGGVVLLKDNRQHLKQNGVVIYLTASAEQIFKRTEKDRKRPLLQTEDRIGRIKELLAVREPLYKEVADVTVNTDGQTVKQVVEFITQQI